MQKNDTNQSDDGNPMLEINSVPNHVIGPQSYTPAGTSMHKQQQQKSTTKILLHKTLQTFNNLPVEVK